MFEQIDRLYPTKLGKLAKDEDQNFMLLNMDGKAFSTNSRILLVWELCSGKSSIKDLSIEIKANTKNYSKDLTKKVSQIISNLEKAKLVELKQLDD